MGLDQYAYAVRPNKANTDFSYVRESIEQVGENDTITTESYVQISYWRKHPNLQGWMEDLFYQKASAQGYHAEQGFNCQPIRLTWDDLKELESAVLGEALPSTEGFFFGESQPEDREDDLKFIAEARKAMSGDYEVYYDSWW
jgi:hypothetical protein